MPHTANSGSFTAKDWTGFRNGNLTAILDTGKKNKDGSHIWLCRCDCGNEVEIPAHRLSRAKSCGCLNKVKFSYSNSGNECSEPDLDGEEWRPINGFSNYEVSNMGRIKSHNYLGKGATRVMTPAQDKKGYLRIALHEDGKRATRKIHRLVAKAFIPNLEGKPEVNHKDGNKKNNRADNLEWASAHENSKHAYQSGLKENNRKWASVLGKTIGREALNRYTEERKVPVVAIRLSDGKEFAFDSQRSAEEVTGVSQGNISRIIKRGKGTGGGYTFRRKGE